MSIESDASPPEHSDLVDALTHLAHEFAINNLCLGEVKKQWIRAEERANHEIKLSEKDFNIITKPLTLKTHLSIKLDRLYDRIAEVSDNDEEYFEVEGAVTIFQFFGAVLLVSAKEYDVSSIFALIDRDENGSLDENEFVHFVETIQEMVDKCLSKTTSEISLTIVTSVKMLGDKILELFHRLDTNHDGEIDKDEWIVGIFTKNLYKHLDFSNRKFVFTRYEFQLIMKHCGFSPYEANNIFVDIDLDANGLLDVHEFTSYQNYLKKHEKSMGNIFLILVQLTFACAIVLKIAILKMDWIELTADMLEVAVTLGVAFLFFQLVFAENRKEEKIIKALENMTILKQQ